METLQKIALSITIIGGINWGLIGIFDWNMITAIITNNTLANIIYILYGITAIINIGILFTDFREDRR